MRIGKRTDALARLAQRMTQQPDGCWTVPTTASTGYASVVYLGKVWPAHRLVCLQVNGVDEYEAEPYHVHHLCEVRNCINPAHLVLLSPLQHKECHAFGHPDYYGNDGQQWPLSDYEKAVEWYWLRGQGLTYDEERGSVEASPRPRHLA